MTSGINRTVLKILKFIALVVFAWVIVVHGAESSTEGGVGVVLGVEGQYVVIRHILPDTAAAAEGSLRAGDRILAVAQGNEPAIKVENGKLAQAVPLLRGPKGTTVRLTIVSPGEDQSQARVVSLVRGEVKALSAWGDGRLLSKGTTAPDIAMVALANRTPERLADYTGKIIVLEFGPPGATPVSREWPIFKHTAINTPPGKTKLF